MKYAMLMLLMITTVSSAQTVRVNSILTADGNVLYDIHPAICYAQGGITYEQTEYGLTINIENIICSDKIFKNGFE